jgi:hypothetical protein
MWPMSRSSSPTCVMFRSPSSPLTP